MRISAKEGHPDHNYAALHAKVFLDGVELRNCVHADEEAGTVECFMTDDVGRLTVNGCGDPEFETLRGAVRVDLSGCTLPLEFIGFDAWLRQRTDAAHQAMMKLARLGGVAYQGGAQ